MYSWWSHSLITFDIMATTNWRERAAAKKQQQQASLPKEWILTNLPDNSQIDVTEFPRTCGLLHAREIEITESHVDVILSNLAKGIWTAVDVTTAFSKRAIVAHQLVCFLWSSSKSRLISGFIRGELSDRNFYRQGSRSSCWTRRTSEAHRFSSWTPPRWINKHLGPSLCSCNCISGLPISLKDQICIKDVETTMGTSLYSVLFLIPNIAFNRLGCMDREAGDKECCNYRYPRVFGCCLLCQDQYSSNSHGL